MGDSNINNTNRRDSNEVDETNNNRETATWIGLAAAGVAALAGGIYWATRSNTDKQTQQTNQTNNQNNSKKSTKVSQGNEKSTKVNQATQKSTKINKQNSIKVNEANQKSTKVTQANEKSTKVTQAIEKSSKASQNNQTDGPSTSASSSSLVSGVINFVSSLTMTRGSMNYSDKIASNPPPSNPIITNLNGLLADIYVRYIQIKDNDFHKHYSVFDEVFQYLHRTMKEVDAYYGKYSSMAQFAGSHYDNLRIKSADEFDMDIVIGLCLNLKENKTNPTDSDFIIQHQSPGFVQLKMGTQYKNLPWRDGTEWLTNQTAYKWKDDADYLLRSKFIDWFKSVVNKALNTLPVQNNTPVFYIKGVPYAIFGPFGPSMTLYIENTHTGFKLDVDLVPCLKFPEERWPINKAYRHIPSECRKGYWMVVGKPDKAAPEVDQTRSWRIALHYQERDLMYNCYNLKTALRLVKCLRDALGMKKIASYYIKTIFLWEILERNDREFWRNSPAYLFELMVNRLHTALVEQKIPYFWNKKNNLIKNVDSRTLLNYAASLEPLIKILKNPSGNNYKNVAKFLLTKGQFVDYNARFLHIET